MARRGVHGAGEFFLKTWLSAALLLLAARAGAADYLLPEPPPAVSTTSARLKFTADRLDYESEESQIHLKGKVTIKESTWTIKADELYLETKRQKARSRGFLLVEDGQSAVFGDSGDFDFKNHSGILYHSSAGHGDWRIHARKVELLPDRRLRYDWARFTSCSLDPKPHYHFRASSVRVTPKKHIIATNAVFFLGPVPVFYLPVLYKPLRPISFMRIKVQPGYDRRNGGVLRGTITNSHGPHLYSKIFLDYYTAQGFGSGGELEHRNGENKGVLYGYRIRETHNGRERWNAVGNAYQRLLSSAAFQGRFEVQSDADFNNDYARARVFRVQPQLINNAAVNYRWTDATARVAYSRVDAATNGPNKFYKQNESAPRVEFLTVPLSIWKLPWLNTFSGVADNEYQIGRPYIQKSVGVGWEGVKTIVLVKGLASWTPKLGYKPTFFDKVETVAERLSTTTHHNAVIGRWFTENTLRFTTPVGDWDATHRFDRRQKADTFMDDAGAPDHGIETNLARLTHAFRPTRTTLTRVSGAYDLRENRDVHFGWRERVQPLVGELYYSPRSALSFIVRDEWRPHYGNGNFLGTAVLGEEDANFVSAGVGYNSQFNNRYLANLEFGLMGSTSTWHVTAALRSEAYTNSGADGLSRFRLFEKEVALAKGWHDFFTRALIRFRPGGVREFQARIDIKLGRTDATDAPKRDWESEWFPERTKQHADDRP